MYYNKAKGMMGGKATNGKKFAAQWSNFKKWARFSFLLAN